MTADEVLETLPTAAWDGPFPPALQRHATDALEAGRVLVLPALRFDVAQPEHRFLNPASLGGDRKNISLDPSSGRLGNTVLAPNDAAALAAMMQRFADSALRLVTGLFPGYAPTLERARTSFRPAEIEGRRYSPRHDDRLLHVDAFPTRPMAGRRILRVFSNVAPDGAPRAWRVGEPFADFARAFLPRVKAPLPGSARVLQVLRLTKGRRSAYDHIMLGLHDAGKLDTSYQADGPKADVSLAAGSTWLCFTDQVLHAALAGHCALEQTFHLPVAALAHPEQAPLRVLERLARRALA
ncbi:MAG TPA: Kdo hydroxylase family protein [Acetobacteraceae bacterium]|nr:Kdo hydroxylase family protein [Acetobacteraceae bacterium]